MQGDVWESCGACILVASGLFINRTNSAAHPLPHDIGPPRQAFSNDITMVDALPLEAVEGVGVTFVPI